MATKKNKHSSLIKKWADGEEIQVLVDGIWVEIKNPTWLEKEEYRVKPESKRPLTFEEALLHIGKIAEYHRDGRLISRGIITAVHQQYNNSVKIDCLGTYYTAKEAMSYLTFEDGSPLATIVDTNADLLGRKIIATLMKWELPLDGMLSYLDKPSAQDKGTQNFKSKLMVDAAKAIHALRTEIISINFKIEAGELLK